MRKRIVVVFVVFFSLLVAKNTLAQSGVTCEYWAGATLSSPADLINTPNLLGVPTSIVTRPNFQAALNVPGAFVARCTAMLVVPSPGGNFTFWIASNKKAMAWLSPSSFLYLSYLCQMLQAVPPVSLFWTRYAEQKSVVQNLAPGIYAIQVVYYDDVVESPTNINHMALGWQLPTGVLERPIPGTRLLSVYPDHLSPSVSIVSPVGSTISGTVTVQATASDNIGIVGVQIYLDGVSFGGTLTTPPYTVQWDTTLSSNGSHTLSATAWDAWGNVTTSSSSIYTLDNSSQLVNPTVVEFDPSADHSLMTSDDPPVPVVDHYTLGFYYVGASEPVSSTSIGKPAPDVSDGKIRFDFSTSPILIGTPLGTFQARVIAVGPMGSGVSEPSNTFTIIR
jgi:hypothetical protein